MMKWVSSTFRSLTNGNDSKLYSIDFITRPYLNIALVAGENKLEHIKISRFSRQIWSNFRNLENSFTFMSGIMNGNEMKEVNIELTRFQASVKKSAHRSKTNYDLNNQSQVFGGVPPAAHWFCVDPDSIPYLAFTHEISVFARSRKVNCSAMVR